MGINWNNTINYEFYGRPIHVGKISHQFHAFTRISLATLLFVSLQSSCRANALASGAKHSPTSTRYY